LGLPTTLNQQLSDVIRPPSDPTFLARIAGLVSAASTPELRVVTMRV
jgi:hypothetical protein